MSKSLDRAVIYAFALSLCGVSINVAAETPIEEVVLEIRPASDPQPALRYTLLPPYSQRTPGNAATVYLRATTIYDQAYDRFSRELDKEEKLDPVVDWLKTKPAELPRAEVQNYLARFDDAWAELAIAARRSYCAWDYPVREQRENLFGILLPEMQTMRGLGRVTALRARLAIADGDFDQAMHALQTGYALARHAAEQPFLVSGLVGIAIAEQMHQQVLAMTEAPGSPNLYWALTALPHPLIDLRGPLELESESVFLMFPELDEARRHALAASSRSGAMSDEDWNSLMQRFLRRFQGNNLFVPDAASEPGSVDLRGAIQSIGMQAYVLTKIGMARERLVGAGRTAEAVEKMSAGEVVLLHTAETYLDLRDDLFKWFYLPYWQARASLEQADNDVAKRCQEREILPLASLLLPAIGNARRAQARGERRLVELQTIESLRYFAAAHGGKFPGRLDQIVDHPALINPMTGQSLVYRVEGKTAILEAIEDAQAAPRRYRIVCAESTAK
ncbi:MAG: hypothetical protein KDA42_03370 [Planctomycetales bacterium]|nr:hypothetical protein [Planctomycetales bacterium]